MSNVLKSTTDVVGSTANQGLSGVQSGGKFVADSAEQGASGVSKDLNAGFDTASGAFSPGKGEKGEDAQPKSTSDGAHGDAPSQESPASPEAEPNDRQSVLGTIGGGVSSGFKGAGDAAGGALQSGAGLIGDVTKSGLHIGETVAKTGLDMTGSVVTGTVGLAGTAVGGVVDMAAETSGAVFEPVVAGLRSVEGLQGLADNLEKINGLPMAAVKEVSSLTFKAMNMSGKVSSRSIYFSVQIDAKIQTPTFFDTDADGIVCVADTIKGLVVLGLEETNARYAAYALHTAFSYSTSDSWIPNRDTSLPINVSKMNNTRWGKNWGSFDRIEWCSDLDIESFFETADKETGTIEKWKQTLTQGRQGFGALLLIFEWGTTWPFWMPPVPATEIPFQDDIGKVIRTVVLPTIFKNWQRSHGIEPNEKNEPKTDEPSK
ncbi:hypothetical protein B0H17DRAFT_1049098 [Mycena rosella]|uniref:Uncharacterized protein n=1 Tax=Mycena rosella TaxID=1033263 RepID=A0AAD7DWJ1_MYCRO|nr:hypothetical protein B0H17DRAFT_1049098 [Mycena rosella]